MPAIKLDKTKPYSECRGERTPDDPHYHVHFYQGGTMSGKKVLLPFDAHGDLVADDGRREPYQGVGFDNQGRQATVNYQPLWTDEMRAYAEAKNRKMKAAASDAGPSIDEDGEKEDEIVNLVLLADEVNFAAWLRGEAKYRGELLRRAAKQRFSRTYSGSNAMAEMVTELVLDERLVPEDQVCPELARYLPKKAG